MHRITVHLGPRMNHHDPKPLWYQFQAEHAGAYSWDYLPQDWRVRIGRPA